MGPPGLEGPAGPKVRDRNVHEYECLCVRYSEAHIHCLAKKNFFIVLWI